MSQPVQIAWHRRAPTRQPSAATQELASLLESDWQRGAAVGDVLRRILSTNDPDEVEVIRAAAERALIDHCGDTVRLRGLIEFSNRCVLDCHYCGIRRGNRAVKRYSLTLEEFASWQRSIDRSGMPGLRVTRIQHYRDLYERQQRF